MTSRRWRGISAAVVALLGSVAPGAASADTARVNALVSSLSTYQSESDIATHRVGAGAYSGVGALFTSLQSTATSGLGAFCSGSLIAADIVITAAHCVAEKASDQATGANFYLPEYASSSDRVRVATTGYLTLPGWNGDVLHGSDIALVKLAAPVGGSQYQIYTLESGLGTTDIGDTGTRIGLGTTGTGAAGTEYGIDGYKRYGLNSYDMTWDSVLDAYQALYPSDGIYGHNGSGTDAFGAKNDSILAYDFDDGTAEHDVFGRYAGYTGANTLGVIDPATGVVGDSSSSPGDSGGPTFINGNIAGITSFGISGNLFETGDCATEGSVDPSKSSSGNCTNSSFGDIGADTRVASYYSYIQNVLAGNVAFQSFASASAVPEAATWAQMVIGFAFVGAAIRSRRPRAAIA